MYRLALKKFFFVLIAVFIYTASDASDIQSVQIEPLTTEISTSTVTLTGRDWETASTSVLRGRKELVILNTSASENIYLSGTSGNSVTVCYILYPRQSVTIKASFDLNVYVTGSSGVIFKTIEIK